jgi:hypothetical protein
VPPEADKPRPCWQRISIAWWDRTRAAPSAAARAGGSLHIVSLAESSALRSGRWISSVAQALHWIGLARFTRKSTEWRRPAALAIWDTRGLVSLAIDALIRRFHDETVGPPVGGTEAGRGGIAASRSRSGGDSATFRDRGRVDVSDLLGYLRTWSAVGKYLSVNRKDPVEDLAPSSPQLGRSGHGAAGRVPLFARGVAESARRDDLLAYGANMDPVHMAERCPVRGGWVSQCCRIMNSGSPPAAR